MKRLGFLALFAFGLTVVSLSFASVPPSGRNVSDTAIYQNNGEITTPRHGRLTFDQDLKNLNEMERRYHENLPRLSDRPELLAPMKRISAQKYRPSQRAGRAAPIRKVKARSSYGHGEHKTKLRPRKSGSLKIVMPEGEERQRPHFRD